MRDVRERVFIASESAVSAANISKIDYYRCHHEASDLIYQDKRYRETVV